MCLLFDNIVYFSLLLLLLFQVLASGLSVGSPHLPAILTSLSEIAKTHFSLFETQRERIINDFIANELFSYDQVARDKQNN